MPRSNSSEESDQETITALDFVELDLKEKSSLSKVTESRFRQFIFSSTAIRLTVSVIIVIIVSVLTFTTLDLGPKYSSSVFTNDCGSTPEEATALGCTFNVLNYSWQPPECFDEEIFNRYWEKAQERGGLKWYADSNLTKELPQDIEVLKHTPHVWTNHRFHVMHCMYTWELLHHGLTLNRPVVETVAEFTHTMHCANTALFEDWKAQNTRIKASHHKCVMLK
jgi:hypothetical protein